MIVQPPPIAPTGSSSLIDFLAITLVIVGVLVAFFAIPAFRSKASEHIKDVSTFVNGNEKVESDPETKIEDKDSLVSSNSRKEIENFNLDIFKEG